MFEFERPRKLNDEERAVLFYILPERKSGYNEYREIITDYYLNSVGTDEGSFILTRNKDTEISGFHTPVFAAGTYEKNKCIYDVVIHEENDDCIEFEINISEDNPGQKTQPGNIIYPEWEPGSRAPGDNSPVREIVLIKDKYLIAIAKIHERLWLYDYKTGINHFISTGAFYSNLCFVKNIREPEVVFNTKLLFLNLDNYTNNELISAFYLYNKSIGKFNIEMPDKPEQPEKKGLFKKFIKRT